MTPIWILPAYPLLIIEFHAGVLSQKVVQKRTFDIILGRFTLQGIGFLVSMMIYSAFIYRLMTQKLPQESTRPGIFVSVGPSGFTVAGTVSKVEGAQRALPANFKGNTPLAAMIIQVMASWISLWIWALALWFFFISVGAHRSCVGRGKMVFAMTWYSYVFPNTALVTSTFVIGKAFKCEPIQILGRIKTPMLICVWFSVVSMMIRAIILKQVLWPQKGEDRERRGLQGAKAHKASDCVSS
jgi:tellurite resistance protein TehA-like permease